MGTDLHIMVEVSHYDEPWHPIVGNEHGIYEAKRDYPLFSMLAGVRNRSGVGSVIQMQHTMPDGTTITFPYDTDDGQHDTIVPIAMPKGIPADASEAWLLYVGAWKMRGGEVITSYVTPDEILAGDWDQVIYREACVFENEYVRYRDYGTPPEHFVGGVGGDAKIISEVEYDLGERAEKGETLIRMHWKAGVLRELQSSFIELTQEIYEARPSTSKMRFMLLFES